MSFCGKCGRKIEGSQECVCTQQHNNVENNQNGQAIAIEGVNQQTNIKKEEFDLMGAMSELKFNQPITVGVNLVKKNSTNLNILAVAILAISMVILSLVFELEFKDALKYGVVGSIGAIVGVFLQNIILSFLLIKEVNFKDMFMVSIANAVPMATVCFVASAISIVDFVWLFAVIPAGSVYISMINALIIQRLYNIKIDKLVVIVGLVLMIIGIISIERSFDAIGEYLYSEFMNEFMY